MSKYRLNVQHFNYRFQLVKRQLTEVALGALAKLLADGCEVTDVRWKTHPVFHGLAKAVVTRSGNG